MYYPSRRCVPLGVLPRLGVVALIAFVLTGCGGADSPAPSGPTPPSSNTVVATVPVGDGPVGVAITPDGAFAYVTNGNSGTVSVIETASNTVVATVRVGIRPAGVAITPDGAFAYVTNIDSGTVSVIETASNTVVTTVGVGG